MQGYSSPPQAIMHQIIPSLGTKSTIKQKSKINSSAAAEGTCVSLVSRCYTQYVVSCISCIRMICRYSYVKSLHTFFNGGQNSMLICKVCIPGSLLYVPKCAFPQWNAFNLTFHFQFDQWTDSYTNDDFYHLLFFNHYLIRLLHLKHFFISFKNLIILDFYSIYYLFHILYIVTCTSFLSILFWSYKSKGLQKRSDIICISVYSDVKKKKKVCLQEPHFAYKYLWIIMWSGWL